MEDPRRAKQRKKRTTNNGTKGALVFVCPCVRPVTCQTSSFFLLFTALRQAFQIHDYDHNDDELYCISSCAQVHSNKSNWTSWNAIECIASNSEDERETRTNEKKSLKWIFKRKNTNCENANARTAEISSFFFLIYLYHPHLSECV